MSNDASSTFTPVETPPPPKKRRTWLWVGGGLAAAVAICLAFGIPAGIARQEAEAEAAAVAAAQKAETARLATFRVSLGRCGVELPNPTGVDVLDGGESVQLSRITKYDGITYSEMECFLNHLKAPQSVEAEIGQTRALDGRQSAEWTGYEASWTYHPDDGASLIVKHVK